MIFDLLRPPMNPQASSFEFQNHVSPKAKQKPLRKMKPKQKMNLNQQPKKKRNA